VNDRALTPACLIACCGRPTAGDDALGPLVARMLRAEGLPPGVELVDVGASPAKLLDHLGNRTALIVVDAMAIAGHTAGELIDCSWEDARHAVFGCDAPTSSTHGLGLAHQLALAEALGLLPRSVRLIGLTIEQTSIGRDPGDAVRRHLPKLVGSVRSVADELARKASCPRLAATRHS
jgi:hydrogenase maturation protease